MRSSKYPLLATGILFLSYCILLCQGREYWVRPNATVNCSEGQRCIDISKLYLYKSWTTYFGRNAQFNFFAGTHYVQSDERVVIGVVEKHHPPKILSISLVGDPGARTIIDCSGTKVGFRFGGFKNFTLSNIEIIRCGCNWHSTHNLNASWLLVRLQRIAITDVVIQNSTGTGLLIYTTKCTQINRSIFLGNNFGKGNTYIVIRKKGMELTILNCKFADGLAPQSSAEQQDQPISSGLTIQVEAQARKKSNITIGNSTFYNNTALTGGHLTVYGSSYHGYFLTITNCKFVSAISNNAGAVSIFYPKAHPERSRSYHVFKDCIVQNNTGGGLKLHAFSSGGTKFTDYMLIRNNTFKHNTAENGAAIFADLRKSLEVILEMNLLIENKASKYGGAIFIREYSIKMVDCKFVKNTAIQGSSIGFSSQTQGMNTISGCTFTGHDNTGGSVIYLSNTKLTINDTKITDNSCRGIHLKNISVLNIKGNVWITRNNAQYGAGIFLDFDPPEFCRLTGYIIVSYDSHLHIEENNAIEYGGGVMVKSGCAVPNVCFIQASQNTGKIHMSGNTAGIAGTAIYGGDLENCFFESLNDILTPEVFWTIFNITERHSGPSVVASQPYKVCICNDNFSTDHSCLFHYNVQVYPGQTFTVPAIGVGQYHYSSPAVIRAVAPQGVRLGEQQVTQEALYLCTNLTFSIQTLQNTMMIELLIETPLSFTSPTTPLQPALINVTILDCPLGFQFFTNLQVCDCSPHLVAEGITSDIAKQSLHKPRSMWIGNFSDHVVAHKHCPFDYCDPSVQDVRLTSQDDQCNWNRTGILCGACRDGYSIVFGTSTCKKCSNIYLLLLVPISLAGLGLVVLMLKCNLTVSTGTLNGLIFYANIVQVNSKMFFTFFSSGPMSTLSYLLSVLIAWINLDLGVEVCFAENLNAFSQTWLQFAFPVYIWCIIGLLIIVCRYSTTVSRLTGSNTVSVLATLFLLSYAKLLRTTLNIFSPITITDPNNTAHLRWILDANYGFLHWPHLTLFLAALFTLVLHLIPFTALLLFGPTLQAHTNYRLLSWGTRIKPFLDAYHGPYKTKYRYWTGLMLLVRVLLLTVFACNALGDPNINLLTIVITAATMLVIWIKIGRIYRKWPINALEVFYILNLMITAVGTLYLGASNSSDTQQQILSLITVGSALSVFIAVMIYHCCSALTETRRGKKLKQKILSMYQNRVTTQEDEVVQPQVRPSSPTRSEVNLRELLLEDKD